MTAEELREVPARVFVSEPRLRRLHKPALVLSGVYARPRFGVVECDAWALVSADDEESRGDAA